MAQLAQQVSNFFARLFSTEGFSPRWEVGSWNGFHSWLHIVSELGLWLAYFAVPLLLSLYILQKKEFPFNRILALFSAFILAGSITHFFDALLFWWPAYRLSSVVCFWIAIISWCVVFALLKILPEALNSQTPAQLEQIAERCTQELAEANRRITETNEKLQLYTVKLEESNKELEQFAAIASHDLQAPLRKMQLFGDCLKQQAQQSLDAVSLDYLERMQKSTRHMQELIKDLLNLSKITRNAKPFVKTNLSTLIMDVLEDLQERIQQTHGQVQIENMGIIEADEAQVHLLLRNLLDNAFKFCREGIRPLITVSFRTLNNTTCEISIQDNGIGFKNEYKDRIFAMFERLHGEKYEGTGIGLAICKRIVEQHGGSITVQSEENNGSRFNVCLPLRQNKSGATSEQTVPVMGLPS